MKKIDNDSFYEFIKKYNPDSIYHFVGEVDYHLLCDNKPYEGMKSHRDALHFVFEWLVEQSIENTNPGRITEYLKKFSELTELVLTDRFKKRIDSGPAYQFFCCHAALLFV